MVVLDALTLTFAPRSFCKKKFYNGYDGWTNKRYPVRKIFPNSNILVFSINTKIVNRKLFKCKLFLLLDIINHLINQLFQEQIIFNQRFCFALWYEIFRENFGALIIWFEYTQVESFKNIPSNIFPLLFWFDFSLNICLLYVKEYIRSEFICTVFYFCEMKLNQFSNIENTK